jgi:glutathione S-transferase
LQIVRETFADASGPITAALFGPADKKDAVVAELREKTFPALLTRLNTLLAGNEWFTGSLSYADVVTYVALNIVDSLGGDATAFPALKAVQARVGALPGIVAYRALRAVRDKAVRRVHVMFLAVAWLASALSLSLTCVCVALCCLLWRCSRR